MLTVARSYQVGMGPSSDSRARVPLVDRSPGGTRPVGGVGRRIRTWRFGAVRGSVSLLSNQSGSVLSVVSAGPGWRPKGTLTTGWDGAAGDQRRHGD